MGSPKVILTLKIFMTLKVPESGTIMLFQITGPSEGFTAGLTDICLFSAMDQFMLFQVTASSEGLTTELTHMWLLPYMDQFMLFKVT